ncbi:MULTISPECIES: hypothetical protein [Cytobacillus]|uniref:hypothetical protein n=1 Tax=Cytobacillus TaxID=2675230 RepID=UPI002040958F|nr:hypothetical protein [Cytobacillus firmus]MCM3707650.1 hypothetical protein [Cytobacillus firmus]
MSNNWRKRFEINADEVEINAERVIVKENRRGDDVRGAEDRGRHHRRDNNVAGNEDNRKRGCGCGRNNVGGAEDHKRRRDEVAGAGDLWYNRDLAGSGRGCRCRRDDDRRRRGFCGCRWL